MRIDGNFLIIYLTEIFHDDRLQAQTPKTSANSLQKTGNGVKSFIGLLFAHLVNIRTVADKS